MQEFAAGKTIAQRMALRPLNCLFRKYRMAVRIMKLTTFILLAACLQLSARGISQTVTISVKDAPLVKVLKAIEKQTDFVFFISSEELKRAKNVSITAKNLPLQQVLDLCFKDQPLTYTITGKLINVVPRIEQVGKMNKTSYITPLPTLIDISGKVIDENGAPARGVNVIVKGTSKGTTTNIRGEFMLKDVNDNAVLLITSIGYDKQEIMVSDKSFISIQLRIAVGNLDEMQVIAYGTTSKRFSTGNITSVLANDIEKQPVNNPLLALEGRVPGLFITQTNGLPGGGVKVRIQGQNSILNGNDPLIIIDGVPYPSQLLPTTFGSMLGNSGSSGLSGNPLNYINPSDIESISILKDADATAIYGSRAANGAILITTKKGKSGKTQYNINFYSGWGKISNHLDLMNTNQYLAMRHEALTNDGLVPSLPNGDYDLLLWDTTRYTDWQKTLVGGTAKFTNANATVSGGNNTVQYFIGTTYGKQTTVFPGNFSDEKIAQHFKLNSNSSNQKFKLEFSGNYSFDDNRLPNTSGNDLTAYATFLAPNAPSLYNEDGGLNWAPDNNGVSTWLNGDHPLLYTLRKYRNKTTSVVSSMDLSYQILPEMEIKSNFGYTNLQTEEHATYPLSSIDPSQAALFQRTAFFIHNSINSWIVEPQLVFKKSISKGKLNILAGFTHLQNRSNGQSLKGEGFNSDLVLDDIKAASKITAFSTSLSNYKYTALFGRLNYIWDEKYLLNLSIRRDGSSRFGYSNQFHSFSSAAIGWIFSQEKIVKTNLSFLSYGKIRGSYGTTGNDQIGDYQFLNLFNPLSVAVPYGGATGLQPVGLPNQYLEWEETKKLQFGVDLGFLKDRILITTNYYRNRSSNQLLNYSLPIIAGFSGITKNFPATIENSGWEFSISTVNLKKSEMEWTSSLNLTLPSSKLVSFPNLENSSYASSLVIGSPINISKVYHSLGVDPVTGKYQFLSAKGDTTFTPNSLTDKTVNINPLPKFFGGFQNSFSYKNFQVDIFFQFVKQFGKNYLLGYYPGGPYSGNQPISTLARWQKPGQVTNVQRYNSDYSIADQYDYANSSDASYSDASYIRLKNASISWQIPERYIHKLYIDRCKLYIQGQNLFTFTNYKGMDPETLSTTSLPVLKILTAGITIGF